MSNYEIAVSTLKTAKNVDQWNTIRSVVKRGLSMDELHKIDALGLIVEVLGADGKV